MPVDTNLVLGTSSIQRRNLSIRGRDGESITFPVWDMIDKCTDDCVIADKCQYSGSKNCKVMIAYIEKILELVQQEFYGTTNEQLFKIGMHLIPLYRVLCKLKLVEASLSDMTYNTTQGGIRMHPVFRELREQFKIIDDTWKDLELKREEAGRQNIPTYEQLTGDGMPVMIQDGKPLSPAENAAAEGMTKQDMHMEDDVDLSDTIQTDFQDVDVETPMTTLLQPAKLKPTKKKLVVPLKWKK